VLFLLQWYYYYYGYSTAVTHDDVIDLTTEAARRTPTSSATDSAHLPAWESKGIGKWFLGFTLACIYTADVHCTYTYGSGRAIR
jgi:hypothetical protein